MRPAASRASSAAKTDERALIPAAERLREGRRRGGGARARCEQPVAQKRAQRVGALSGSRVGGAYLAAMCKSERNEPRERPRPSSPGLQLLAFLEGMRADGEMRGIEHSPDELNLSHIAAELGLAGLVCWRMSNDNNHTAWQLDSRETLVWHRGAAGLWTCWSSVAWLRWTGETGGD